MHPTRPHVIVIGAGAAGSVAAVALARRGLDVTLIERSTFPRDKVCGECLSAVGTETLRRLGLAHVVRTLGPSDLTHSTIVAHDGSAHTLTLPRPMWGVRRSTMDAALADAARRLGVRVEQPRTASRVEPATAGGGPRVHLRDAVLDCDVVIVADGTSALLNGRPTPTGDFGLKAHFRDVDAPRDHIELVGLGGGTYAGLAPVDGGLFNAAWTVPAATLRRYGGDLDRLFGEHVASHAWLRRCFARAVRVGEWHSCPLPRFAVRPKWPTGIVPIGNAAAALEPVGGEGMGLGMRSAELAAEGIADALEAGRPVDVRGLRRAFRSLWSRRRMACRAAAVALADARLGPLAVDALHCSPAIGRIGLRLVGK